LNLSSADLQVCKVARANVVRYGIDTGTPRRAES